MFSLSGPVKAAVGGVLATFAGMTAYNLSSRPTTQTVQGIDNTTLLAGLAVAGLFIFINR